MSQNTSKLETIRQHGKTQVESQRVSILDAAEKVFLEKGLEKTSMSDIASAAGITRMTLYRYFPDRDPIAFEIAVRMLSAISGATNTRTEQPSLDEVRSSILRMVDQFPSLRDAYRYLGMFDHLYGSTYPSEQLAAWYKEQIFGLNWALFHGEETLQGVATSQLVMVGNATMSFLQKMAARGELLSAEQEVSLEDQLAHYRSMINTYFDSLMASKR